MRWIAFILTLFAAPASASVADVPPIALHCVKALMEGTEFKTKAMQAISPEQAGVQDALPDALFYHVPNEQVMLSYVELTTMKIRGCMAFPDNQDNGWDGASVARAISEFGFKAVPACSSDDAKVWFSTEINRKGRGITVGLKVLDDVVKEFVAFETHSISTQQDCQTAVEE